MTNQVCRLLATLTLTFGAAFGLAACGDNGDKTSSDDQATSESTSASASASPTPDEPWTFDQVPGKALSYQRYGNKFTVELKPILIQWNSQFAEQPADPGSKFLTVFTAVRPKLRDRGVNDLTFDEIWLRFEPVAGGCDYPSHVGNVETCFVKNQKSLQPIPMEEADWRTESWGSADIMGANLNDGEEYRVPLFFPIKDGTEAKNGFQLCGNPDGTFSQDNADLPCVPVPMS